MEFYTYVFIYLSIYIIKIILLLEGPHIIEGEWKLNYVKNHSHKHHSRKRSKRLIGRGETRIMQWEIESQRERF